MDRDRPAIIVCHSLPTNWCGVAVPLTQRGAAASCTAAPRHDVPRLTVLRRMLPSPMSWVGEKCPPDVTDAAYVYLIGRTMFETDRCGNRWRWCTALGVGGGERLDAWRWSAVPTGCRPRSCPAATP